MISMPTEARKPAGRVRCLRSSVELPHGYRIPKGLAPMPPSNIATAADYADAMMIARRAKNTLFLLLIVMLLGQIAIFLVARFTNHIPIGGTSLAGTVSVAPPTTGPAATQPAMTSGLVVPVLRYLTALIDFL